MNIPRLMVGIAMILAGTAMVIFCSRIGRWYSKAIRAFAGRDDAAPEGPVSSVLVAVVGLVVIAFGVTNLTQAMGG